MAPERFFSRVRQDIFRPFTGRHRGIAFEVTVDLYDRLLGATADDDLVLNRDRLMDIVGTAIANNRDLIVGNTETAGGDQGNEDEEFDQSLDDRDYARRLITRLAKYGIVESYSDATHLTVLWRFTRRESASPRCSPRRGAGRRVAASGAFAPAARRWSPSCARKITNIWSTPTSIQRRSSTMSARSPTSSTSTRGSSSPGTTATQEGR